MLFDISGLYIHACSYPVQPVMLYPILLRNPASLLQAARRLHFCIRCSSLLLERGYCSATLQLFYEGPSSNNNLCFRSHSSGGQIGLLQ